MQTGGHTRKDSIPRQGQLPVLSLTSLVAVSVVTFYPTYLLCILPNSTLMDRNSFRDNWICEHGMDMGTRDSNLYT